MKRAYLSLISAVCIGWLGFAPAFGSQGPAAAPPASPALAGALEQAYKLINTRQFQQGKVELERAASLAGGPCGECLLGMSYVYEWEKKWDEALDAAQRALPLLSTPALQARAYDQLGMVYMVLRAPGSLVKSEDALRQGASLGGGWGAMARYHLVEVLMMQEQWGKALEEARQYLKEAGSETSTYTKQAHIFICWSRDRLPADSPPQDSMKLLRVGKDGVPNPPEILYRENPDARPGDRGTVILEALVDEEGCVRNVKTLKESYDGLAEPAVKALRKWVFLPVQSEGKPAKLYYVQSITFK